MDRGNITQSKQDGLNRERFVKICDREDRCELPCSIWRPITDKYELQKWKGIPIDKSPLEIALYPMLLYELQPKTVIELGSGEGGSALWLADCLERFGIESRVYSIDINLSQLYESAKVSDRITFLEGDCNQIDTILPPDFLSNLAHPWLVVEDAHINLIGVLDHLHRYGLQSGDYLIVEDTNQDLWQEWSDWNDREFLTRMGQKMDNLRNWLKGNQEEYLVDSYYQDMYGYNASKNWNSILKKV